MWSVETQMCLIMIYIFSGWFWFKLDFHWRFDLQINFWHRSIICDFDL